MCETSARVTSFDVACDANHRQRVDAAQPKQQREEPVHLQETRTGESSRLRPPICVQGGQTDAPIHPVTSLLLGSVMCADRIDQHGLNVSGRCSTSQVQMEVIRKPLSWKTLKISMIPRE